jgi:hypothetical protein
VGSLDETFRETQESTAKGGGVKAVLGKVFESMTFNLGVGFGFGAALFFASLLVSRRGGGGVTSV